MISSLTGAARFAESVEYAQEFMADAPEDRAKTLARLMGDDATQRLQALAIHDARRCLDAAWREEHADGIMASFAWDEADRAIRAALECGVEPQEITGTEKEAA